MNKIILATLENYDGLTTKEIERLRKMAYTSDHVFEVKDIELSNGSYKVVIEANVRGEKTSFVVNAENVNLYERYDDDYKVYKPLEDPDFNNQKEKGEN